MRFSILDFGLILASFPCKTETIILLLVYRFWFPELTALWVLIPKINSQLISMYIHIYVFVSAHMRVPLLGIVASLQVNLFHVEFIMYVHFFPRIEMNAIFIKISLEQMQITVISLQTIKGELWKYQSHKMFRVCEYDISKDKQGSFYLASCIL